MAFETITVETEGGVALVRLNRPQALNALNSQLTGELAQALTALDRDPAVAGTAARLGCGHAECDVTDEASASAAIAAAAARMGRITAAVNCAGIAPAARVVGRDGPHPLGLFRQVIEVNLVGSFNVAKAGAHLMQHNAAGSDGERGAIINTASVAAFEGQIGQAAYSASKGGVVGMTLPMARELARFGVRVVTIAPGIFMTPMAGGMPPDVKASLEAMVPFPSRLGEPAEFADAVCFALSNRYLNGTTMRLDGAVRLQPK